MPHLKAFSVVLVVRFSAPNSTSWRFISWVYRLVPSWTSVSMEDSSVYGWASRPVFSRHVCSRSLMFTTQIGIGSLDSHSLDFSRNKTKIAPNHITDNALSLV